MTYREGERIFFNPDEQAVLADGTGELIESMPVHDAVELAHVCLARATDLTTQDKLEADSATREAAYATKRRQTLAENFAMIGSRIIQDCKEEYLDYMAHKPEDDAK